MERCGCLRINEDSFGGKFWAQSRIGGLTQRIRQKGRAQPTAGIAPTGHRLGPRTARLDGFHPRWVNPPPPAAQLLTWWGWYQGPHQWLWLMFMIYGDDPASSYHDNDISLQNDKRCFILMFSRFVPPECVLFGKWELYLKNERCFHC